MKILLSLFAIVLLIIKPFDVYAAVNSSSKETQYEQPKMRVVDRDWQYFKTISCNLINDVKFNSRSEEILIAKRKSQCVNKYEAFLPKPIER